MKTIDRTAPQPIPYELVKHELRTWEAQKKHAEWVYDKYFDRAEEKLLVYLIEEKVITNV